MVRLSSPISSRLILAISYALIGGLAFYAVFWLLYGGIPSDEPSSFLYKSRDHSVLQDLIKLLNILGPVWGTLVSAAPFLPFTFAYASFVCPSCITITDTEIRAKFFTGEKRWPMAELKSVGFQTAGQNEFIILKVTGKTLKAEIEHGRWGAIRDLLPYRIINQVSSSTTAEIKRAPPQRQIHRAVPDSLTYHSIDQFESDYRAEIYQQASQMREAFEWWMEPLWFYDRLNYPYQLTGQSKLCRPNPVDQDGIPIFGQEIPLRENALMSYVDAERIISLLQALSEEHKVTWTVFENNGQDEIGTIDEGTVSASITSWLGRIRDSWAFTQAELNDEFQHKRIRDHYTGTIMPGKLQNEHEYLPPEREIGS